MKLIVAGSRGFDDYALLSEKCDKYLSRLIRENPGGVEIVSGGARGADKLGERYAAERGYPLTVFRADWSKYGKRAGYIRNAQMAEYSDGLIAFWDEVSPGTKHMIDIAVSKGLKVYVVYFG